MLEIEQQRAEGCSGRSRRRALSGRAVHSIGAETYRRAIRGVVQEAQHRVKDVASGKEPAEHLSVVAVHELAAELDGVLAREDGKVVPDLIALEHFVDLRFKEEGRAKAESCGKSHGSICRDIR